MKFVKLKDSFIREACRIDNEFMTNINRGYAIVIEYSNNRYLISLRSNVKHKYCFKNEITNKYLDYTKSFKLINDNIIDREFKLSPKEYGYYYDNREEIINEFVKFNKIRHNIIKSVDISKMNMLQKKY